MHANRIRTGVLDSPRHGAWVDEDHILQNSMYKVFSTLTQHNKQSALAFILENETEDSTSWLHGCIPQERRCMGYVGSRHALDKRGGGRNNLGVEEGGAIWNSQDRS
ncbi:hypothetical protein V6N13_076786 [Hibiscus sabdariffa]|uniref:Uncharacterized protein n=1 Tax=Hibiscus sabdariffa TaxID=183260 RepID=A0ABR2NGT7_9ROSI